MVEILPGILEKDWSKIEKRLEIIKPFAKSVHIDLIDGKFALASPASPNRGEPTGGSNVTFLDPAPFAKYSQELFLELHMMVDNPIQYLESFAAAGFKRFIGHVEMMPDQVEFVTKAQESGEAGLAIDGPTPLENIKVPLSDLDCVLVMMIKAGASGQAFNQEYLKKIEMLKPHFAEASRGKQVQHDIETGPIIEVDGGINDQTITLAKAAGASRFVSTSFIFGGEDPQMQFNLLKKGVI